MWMFVKDHLRRNWKSLTLMSLGFACFASLMMWEVSDTLNLTKSFPWAIYAYYAILASLIGMDNDLNFIRFSRTLPFRESTLANLVWSMAVVAPPVFSFVIVLLLGCLAFCFGKASSLPIAWPLLFLLLATLFSGVLTFVGALIPRMCDPLMARHHVQKGCASSALYFARALFAVPCAAAVIVLLFFPTPTRWSDLTPLHLAGMGLAAFLTWRSYRLRYWLLKFDFPRNAISRRSPKLESYLKSRESAPLHYGSVLAAVAKDLKATVLQSIINVLVGIGVICFTQFCLAWSGLAPRGSNIYESFTPAFTLLAVLIATTSIFDQFGRVSVLGAVRALPLTGNQCALLFLGYPYAATLAVIPCITAYLWLKGYGYLSILLLGGILLSAVLCPFAMFLVARFGRRSRYIIMGGFFFVGDLVFIYPAQLMPLSTPTLCAGALVLAVLGFVGYFGLRHLIENNSAVYKRKLFPQQFGQRQGQ